MKIYNKLLSRIDKAVRKSLNEAYYENFDAEENGDLIEYNGFYIQLKYDMHTFSYSVIIKDSHKNEVDTLVDLDNEDEAVQEGKNYIDELIQELCYQKEEEDRYWEEIFPLFDDSDEY